MSATDAIGTPLYMSPEQWESHPLTAKSDVFAFGVLLNEMLHGQPPWVGEGVESAMAIGFKVVGGNRPELTDHGLREVITQCWRPNPAERINMQKVLERMLPSWDR